MWQTTHFGSLAMADEDLLIYSFTITLGFTLTPFVWEIDFKGEKTVLSQTCLGCGTDNDIAAAKCKKCGKPLKGPKVSEVLSWICLACGAKNDIVEVKCRKCGKLLKGPNTA
jgi:ribosomal protein L40E